MSEIRPDVYGKAMALDGDKTTTGATCIATIQTATFNGKRKYNNETFKISHKNHIVITVYCNLLSILCVCTKRLPR